MKRLLVAFLSLNVLAVTLNTLNPQDDINSAPLNQNFTSIETELINIAKTQKGWEDSDLNPLGSLITLGAPDNTVIKADNFNNNFNYLKALKEKASIYADCRTSNSTIFGYDMTNASAITGQGPDSCTLTCNQDYSFIQENKNCELSNTTIILSLENTGANLYDWKNHQVTLSQILIDAGGVLSNNSCPSDIIENSPACDITINYNPQLLTLPTSDSVTSLPYNNNEISITATIEAPTRACEIADIDLNEGSSLNVESVQGIAILSEPTADYSNCTILTCNTGYQRDTNNKFCLKEVSVTISKNGDGSIDSDNNSLDLSLIDLTKNATMIQGDTLSFIANDGDNYEFSSWTGSPCDGSSSNICNTTLSTLDINLTANYTIRQCSSISDITTTNPSLNTTGIDPLSITGDYGVGCSYSCSTPDYVENTSNQNIACDEALDPPVLATFNITDDYTRFNNSSISISGIDIEEYQIYNSLDCSGTIVYPWSTAKPNSVTIITQNANNNYSLKTRNSAGESNCLSDSVIHDNTSPTSISISSPVNNAILEDTSSSQQVCYSYIENDVDFINFYKNGSYMGRDNNPTNTDCYNANFGSSSVFTLTIEAVDYAGNTHTSLANTINWTYNFIYTPIKIVDDYRYNKIITENGGNLSYSISRNMRFILNSNSDAIYKEDPTCSDINKRIYYDTNVSYNSWAGGYYSSSKYVHNYLTRGETAKLYFKSGSNCSQNYLELTYSDATDSDIWLAEENNANASFPYFNISVNSSPPSPNLTSNFTGVYNNVTRQYDTVSSFLWNGSFCWITMTNGSHSLQLPIFDGQGQAAQTITQESVCIEMASRYGMTP